MVPERPKARRRPDTLAPPPREGQGSSAPSVWGATSWTSLDGSVLEAENIGGDLAGIGKSAGRSRIMQVFISHAAGDARLAQRIADRLRSCGLEVWDESCILPGDNWGLKLAEALQTSDAMVVLLTKDSAASPNVSYEVGYALGNSEYRGRVVPVVAAPPRDPSESEIPWVLRRFEVIRLRGDERDDERLKKVAEAIRAPVPTS